MIRIIYILLFFWSSAAVGQTQNVLFIGNSFTMNFEMPRKFSQIAKNEGKSVFVKQLTKGGMDWQYHATNPNTYQTIKSEPWDYVVLQGKSFEPLFDSITVERTTKRYGKQMIDSIRHHWPNAKIMLFMTWGYAEGIELDQDRGYLDYTEMQNRLKRQYLSFAEEFKVAVAPVGEIWKQVKSEYPTLNLYDTDNYHQNKAGSFLIASTFYNMIFESSLEHFNNIPYSLDEKTTRALADKSRDVVLNPQYDWRMNYWLPPKEDDFTYFDFKFKKDTLILKAEVSDEYTVKWKLDGKIISKEEKVVIPLNDKEEFELQLILKEGLLRGRRTEEAIFEGGKKLIPTD
jgi:hypothetical protein